MKNTSRENNSKNTPVEGLAVLALALVLRVGVLGHGPLEVRLEVGVGLRVSLKELARSRALWRERQSTTKTRLAEVGKGEDVARFVVARLDGVGSLGGNPVPVYYYFTTCLTAREMLSSVLSLRFEEEEYALFFTRFFFLEFYSRSDAGTRAHSPGPADRSSPACATPTERENRVSKIKRKVSAERLEQTRSLRVWRWLGEPRYRRPSAAARRTS